MGARPFLRLTGWVQAFGTAVLCMLDLSVSATSLDSDGLRPHQYFSARFISLHSACCRRRVRLYLRSPYRVVWMPCYASWRACSSLWHYSPV